MSSILIRNGTLVTMDSQDSVLRGEVFIVDGRIAEVGGAGQAADTVIDATDCAVIPGFVQTHIHLCQTLFRGAADDLALIDWLKQRVWPMILKRAFRCVLLLLGIHLVGTFTAIWLNPNIFFVRGVPFCLTVDGEFVIKNVVLISAALVIAGYELKPLRKP